MKALLRLASDLAFLATGIRIVVTISDLVKGVPIGVALATATAITTTLGIAVLWLWARATIE